MIIDKVKELSLVFIGIVSLISQLRLLPDIARVLLSLPYFVVVPLLTGELFMSLLKNIIIIPQQHTAIKLSTQWITGIIILVSLMLLLQIIGIYNMYLYGFTIIFIIVLARMRSLKQKPKDGTEKRSFQMHYCRENYPIRSLRFLKQSTFFHL